MIHSEARALVDCVQHSQAWHDMRRRTITATDLPALLGLNPSNFRNADEAGVREKKRADYVPPNPTAAMRRGTRLEPEILDWYATEFDCIVEHSPPMLQNKEHEWATASIDGFAYAKGEADPWPVEVKTTAVEQPGSCPAYWQAQIQWQLFVSGWQFSDLVAYQTKAREYWVQRIQRDDEWIAQAFELVNAWRLVHLDV